MRTDATLVDGLRVLQLLGLPYKVHNPYGNLLDFRVVIYPYTEFYITLPMKCEQQLKIKQYFSRKNLDFHNKRDKIRNKPTKTSFRAF